MVGDWSNFMGIAKKCQRKIIVRNRQFFWCVRHDIEDEDRLHLIIKSDCKKFTVSYMFGEKDSSRVRKFIINKGKEFKGLDNLGHFWERFIVPEWEDKIITPSLVSQIIEWCLTEEDVIPVDCEGNILNKRYRS